jgi:hypothetical protein
LLRSRDESPGRWGRAVDQLRGAVAQAATLGGVVGAGLEEIGPRRAAVAMSVNAEDGRVAHKRGESVAGSGGQGA